MWSSPDNKYDFFNLKQPTTVNLSTLFTQNKVNDKREKRELLLSLPSFYRKYISFNLPVYYYKPMHIPKTIINMNLQLT